MANFILAVNDNLETRMDEHPEINWNHVARESIRSKLTELEIMDQLADGIDLTEEEIDEIADEINRRATDRAMRTSKTEIIPTSQRPNGPTCDNNIDTYY